MLAKESVAGTLDCGEAERWELALSSRSSDDGLLIPVASLEKRANLCINDGLFGLSSELEFDEWRRRQVGREEEGGSIAPHRRPSAVVGDC